MADSATVAAPNIASRPVCTGRRCARKPAPTTNRKNAAVNATPAHLRVVVARREGLLQVSLPKRRGPPLVHPIALRLAA